MTSHATIRAQAQRSFAASASVIAACHRISISAASLPERREEPGATAPLRRPAHILSPKASGASPASPQSSGSASEAGRPANISTLERIAR